MIGNGKQMTYTVYELPGAIVCGNCGHIMQAKKDHAVYHIGQKRADFECTNQLCSDKGIKVPIEFKRHDIEVKT